VIDVNLTALFVCSRTAARSMIRARRGAIVNVASIMGLSGGGLYPNASYQASKAQVVNLTRALAVEWAASGFASTRSRRRGCAPS
jgi:NAD(P)-dependent dehydrogenase (short-subunit alcohol dehydrogenase family)